MAWHAAQTEQVREYVDHVEGLQLAGYTDRQALASELIDHVQHPVLATVMRTVLDKVIRPDVVRPL